MQNKNEKYDIWSEASDKYMRRKLKELVKEWQRDRKAKGLPWSISALGKEMHNHRNTISEWLNGENKPPIDHVCKFFKVDPSYFVAQNLDELDIMDENHHLWMQSNAEGIADKYGVKKVFLWYLKSDQKIQDMVLFYQHTDAILNSGDPDVPDANSPFQFINSKGVKDYLNDDSLKTIGEIEPKVMEYIEFLLWKEYEKDQT